MEVIRTISAFNIFLFFKVANKLVSIKDAQLG